MVAKVANGPSPLQAVLEAVERERAAVAAGDWAAYLAALSVDAVFMPPGSPTRSGDDLRGWLRAFVQDFRIEWLSFESTEVNVVEDLAYHTFTYEWRLSPRGGGEGKVSSGKGLHILRHDEDAGWRISREIWNASPG